MTHFPEFLFRVVKHDARSHSRAPESQQRRFFKFVQTRPNQLGCFGGNRAAVSWLNKQTHLPARSAQMDET